MNTHNIREKSKNFPILLDSVCSSSIRIGNMTFKLRKKEDVAKKWQTQARNSTTDKKVNVFLPT